MKMGKLVGLVAIIGTMTLAVPSLSAAQAPGDDIPASRTVTGTDIGHYKNGPSPVDLSAVTVAAYVPNGSGGYNTISGSGTKNGTFSIPNVATGPYVLQLGTSFLVTSNTVVDADFSWGFRSNGVPANPSTQVTFDLSNLESWQNTDVFELVCPNNAAFDEFDGTLGETTFTGTFPYSPFVSENLSDASQGDQYVILQLSTQNVAGLPFTGASRAIFPPKFTQAQGSDTPINGTLGTLPQKYEFEANINGADLTTQAASANPNTTLVNTGLVLDAYPGSVAKGERTSTPDLVGYNLSNFSSGPNITTNADFGTVSYGNPFPSTFPLFVLYDWVGQTSYTAPGATNSLPLITLVQGFNTALPAPTSPVKPLVGVVSDALINGLIFFDSQNVGLTPTLTWSPPILGTATFYEVDIYQLSNQGGNTVETAFYSVRTKSTALTIPPGLMSAGQGYVFVIRSWYIPGLNFAKTPFMSGPVSASSDVISGLMQP
jgi:hypothetical protein